MSTKSLRKIFEERARVGPAYLWLAPPLNPTTGLVDLALSGNDPNDVVPVGVPRPVSGGTYLGYDEQGVTETPVLAFEPVLLLGGTIPVDVRVKEEKASVKARLIFNNDIPIVSLLRPPGNNVSLFQFSYGGKTKVPIYPLLVILTNALNEQDYVECHYYFRGYFDPATTVSGKLFTGLDMSFNALAGLNGNCLLPEGSRIMRGWFVRVDLNGTNTLVAPRLLNGYGASGFEAGGAGDMGSEDNMNTSAILPMLTGWINHI